jgi:hypothetical protein
VFCAVACEPPATFVEMPAARSIPACRSAAARRLAAWSAEMPDDVGDEV